MPPFIAQGATQEIEDGGVLAILVSLADGLNTVLAVYEYVRKERVEAIQDAKKRWTVLWLVDGVQ